MGKGKEVKSTDEERVNSEEVMYGEGEREEITGNEEERQSHGENEKQANAAEISEERQRHGESVKQVDRTETSGTYSEMGKKKGRGRPPAKKKGEGNRDVREFFEVEMGKRNKVLHSPPTPPIPPQVVKRKYGQFRNGEPVEEGEEEEEYEENLGEEIGNEETTFEEKGEDEQNNEGQWEIRTNEGNREKQSRDIIYNEQWLKDMKSMEERIVKRLLENLRETKEEIKKEISPIPCRCEQMNTIIKDLVGESEQWRYKCYRDKELWREEKEELMKEIEYWKKEYEENIQTRMEEEMDEERQRREVMLEEGTGNFDGNNNRMRNEEWREQGKMKEAEPATVRDRVEQAKEKQREEDKLGWREVQKKRKQKSEEEMLIQERRGNYLREKRGMIQQRKPKPLSERIMRDELNERAERRTEICITKMNKEVRGRVNRREFLEVIQRRCNMEFNGMAREIYEKNGRLFVNFHNLADKKELMRRRGNMRGTDIWLEDSLTRRQREIKKWMREIAALERNNGQETDLKYMRIRIGQIWWKWNEGRGSQR